MSSMTFSKKGAEKCKVSFPGFCDVHVHFREPGFSYKETILTGSLAAARGGYTDVCTMPNLSPVPDTYPHLKKQLDIISKDAVINVHPYGAITMNESGNTLSDMESMAPFVCAFSDDGKGVQSESMMRSAMEAAKKLGKIIAAHCEDNSLLFGGYIHDGSYAHLHGHAGISSESEYRQIERDIRLCAETGCSYHVCHISCSESVDLIRNAKKNGIDITCETAPHYLILDENCIEEDGRFKMNPPLRSSKDKDALLAGLADGTIDMIATDHAPHSAEEKSRGLKDSLFGITGIETAFPLLYSYLVRKDIITLDRLIFLLTELPRKRFGIPLSEGDETAWDLSVRYTVDKDDLISMGKATPFEGTEVYGKCLYTKCKGRTVYNGDNV